MTRNEAQKAANKLCKLLGKDWYTHVWENMGWHYSCISACGRWKIYPSIAGYTAFLGDADSVGGQWACTGATPQLAIQATLKEAFENLKYVTDLLVSPPIF